MGNSNRSKPVLDLLLSDLNTADLKSLPNVNQIQVKNKVLGMCWMPCKVCKN